MRLYSASHKEMRISTLMKVINAVREGACNKNEIQEITGLSWGSCSEIISLFSDEYLIKSCKIEAKNKGRPGRKATGFEFNSKKFLLAGMELKAQSVVCSLVSLGKVELNREEYQLPQKLTNENVYQQISSLYINFLVDSGVKSEAVLGLSLSLTGAVDPVNKKLIFSPRYDSLKDVDFSKLKEFLPFIKYFNVDHDINAQSSSVMDKNGWKDENYAFVHFGEGVGMAFYHKENYTGARGFAGEIGHVPYQGMQKDKTCPCGKKNCFEAFLSNDGIRDLIREITGTEIADLKNLDESILSHSKLCGIIADAASQMLILISNILDPGAIIIGGEAIEPFLPKIKTKVETKLREAAWQGGAKAIKWYSPEDINCAYGTIINSSGKMIEQYIKETLI
jgi:predicted NBD/HSP70 family sugar kinase